MVKTVKSILYLVENKTRDLDAILYFAKEILGKKNNLKVHIMPISRINFNNLCKLQKSVIIWPHPRHFLINWSYFLGHINIVHETEGVPYRDETLFHSSNFFHNFSIHQVWCWGNNQNRILKERFKNSFLSNKIITTGSIRYEFARKKNKVFGQSKTKRPKALITTNYNILNPRYQSLFNEMMDHKNNYKLETADPNIFLKWMISETERRLIFMSKIKKEHKVLSNFDVELRPHPFEALDYYHEEVLSPIKFKIQDYSVDISEAISNSQIVIATGCQTVLDSIVNKKPVFGNSEGNYNLWDKFILPLDDLSNIEINDGEFNKLADKQFKNALKLGLGEWLNNFLYDFDYSYLIALLNEKHNSKYVIRNFIKIIFYTLKIIKIIPKILKKIFFYSVNKKQRKIKFFGSNDILDAKLRICPKLQAKVLKEKVVLFN